MDNGHWRKIRKIIASLSARTARSSTPPANQQSEPEDMEVIDEYIRKEMERFDENITATSGSSQPSVPPVQPSPETVQQPYRDREAAPVDSTSLEPTVEIVEQPVKSRRFRYDCEIESAGAIQGVQRMKGQKSFPKIKIGNYVGPAEITVSLVCKNKPYRVHPNGIVGKKKSSEKNFTYIYVKNVQVTTDNCVFQFNDLGIRMVRPHQIEEALQDRETRNVDPFGQGFTHKFDPKIDDLQAVRLCFQVKLSQERRLDPVVSDVIYHSKNSSFGCLQITEMIPSGPKVILFSQPQQLNPKDVEVVFYKKENGNVWERCVKKFDISDTSGIVCAVPPYTRADIECDTEVSVFLRRLSDGICGAPRPFTYYADSDTIIKRKRKMAKHIIQDFATKNWTLPASLVPDNDSQYDQDWRNMPGPFDDNPIMPGPSSVNPAVPKPSHVNSAVPRLSYTNPAVPGSISVNPAVPGPSFVNAAVSGLNHVNSDKPWPSHVNSVVPGPSFINPVVSRTNHDNSAMPRPSSVNPAMPGPSSVNAGVLGPNCVKSAVPEPGFVNSAVPKLIDVNPSLPEPTESPSMQTILSMLPDMVHTPSISQPMSVPEDEGFFSPAVSVTNDENAAMPRPNSVNPAMPGPSSLNAGVLGPNCVKSAVPEPGFVNSAVPRLIDVNPFLPEPSESPSMQTLLSMLPDMVHTPSISQPMLVPEDEGFFSPNGNLDNDGEYSGEDSALANVCYSLISF